MWLGKHRIISPERRHLPEAYSMAEQFATTSPYELGGLDFHDDDPAPRVVVGYDARYGSHVFATTTAEVFAGAGGGGNTPGDGAPLRGSVASFH